MNLDEYEVRVVRIMDAEVRQDWTEDGPDFVQTLVLLLQDVETNKIFHSSLQDKDIKQLLNTKNNLSSGELIKFSLLLKQREEPVRMFVPKNSKDINVEEILESKKLDQNRKNRYRKNKRKFYNNRQNFNRKNEIEKNKNRKDN